MEKKTDLRITKTYLSLHNAFTSLLEEKRFEEFTLNELCERAMIRRTTFYKHFADKYEYFSFYMKEICAEFQSQLPKSPESANVNDYFLHMCRELLHFINRHEKLVHNLLNSSMAPVLTDSLLEQIMCDVLSMLHHIPSAQKYTAGQMQDIAAFYSGGIVNSLKVALRKEKKIREEEFLSSIEEFLTHNLY